MSVKISLCNVVSVLKVLQVNPQIDMDKDISAGWERVVVAPEGTIKMTEGLVENFEKNPLKQKVTESRLVCCWRRCLVCRECLFLKELARRGNNVGGSRFRCTIFLN